MSNIEYMQKEVGIEDIAKAVAEHAKEGWQLHSWNTISAFSYEHPEDGTQVCPPFTIMLFYRHVETGPELPQGINMR